MIKIHSTARLCDLTSKSAALFCLALAAVMQGSVLSHYLLSKFCAKAETSRTTTWARWATCHWWHLQHSMREDHQDHWWSWKDRQLVTIPRLRAFPSFISIVAKRWWSMDRLILQTTPSQAALRHSISLVWGTQLITTVPGLRPPRLKTPLSALI